MTKKEEIEQRQMILYNYLRGYQEGEIRRTTADILIDINEKHELFNGLPLYNNGKAIQRDLKVLEERNLIARIFFFRNDKKLRLILRADDRGSQYGYDELVHLVKHENHKIEKVGDFFTWYSKKDGEQWTIHSLKDYDTLNQGLHHLYHNLRIWRKKLPIQKVKESLAFPKGYEVQPKRDPKFIPPYYRMDGLPILTPDKVETHRSVPITGYAVLDDEGNEYTMHDGFKGKRIKFENGEYVKTVELIEFESIHGADTFVDHKGVFGEVGARVNLEQIEEKKIKVNRGICLIPIREEK